ncbi:subtilisin-like serine protease [Orbilia oligospora]|uniref:Subtilisin-like serine protease n=1 Tax=Orbilia oligospora TaxID=2813651 RepID=A0A7C8REI1_ORBOL|nr:subtilisin-like serine protease [Orbilia oligospora]
MQELSLLVFITTISVALAAPLVSEKRQQPQTVTIVEQPNAPWGLQRISSPDPIPLEIRPKSREMAFRYQYDQSSGQGVDVYVIDGGVNVTHPEFEGRAKMLYNDFKDDNNDAGVHIVASAGNDNKDACDHWPSAANQNPQTQSIISVGATAPAVAGVLASELVLNPSLRLDPIGLKRHILSKGVPIPSLGVLVNTRINEMQ